MKNCMFAFALAIICCSTVYADGNFKYQKTKVYSNSTSQGVAEIQASRGSIGHHGGNRGYEGVGFSTVSAEAAIRNCCYWGQKTPVEIGVARGPNGWYACVRYR